MTAVQLPPKQFEGRCLGVRLGGSVGQGSFLLLEWTAVGTGGPW